MRIIGTNDNGTVNIFGESAGQQIRRDIAGNVETLPTPTTTSVCVCVGSRTIAAKTHKPTNTTTFKPDDTGYRYFRDDRKEEYLFMCKCRKILDSNARIVRMLCVYAKHDSSDKNLVGIIVHDPRGYAYFKRDRGTLVFVTKIDDASRKTIRRLLGVSNDVRVYTQDLLECLKAYRHSAKRHETQQNAGMRDNAPRDRKPQRYILRGRPIAPVKD